MLSLNLNFLLCIQLNFKMAEKTLRELAELRAKGVVEATDEEIMRKRAERAAKKQKHAAQQEIIAMFPDFEQTKSQLRRWTAQIRFLRKQAVEKNIRKFVLPEDLKKKVYMAYKNLPYLDSQVEPTAKGGLAYNYQTELGDLAIEGLKIQDRELKVATFNYLNENIFPIIIDWPMILRMLNKYYVSRYGWALLRNFSDRMPVYAGDLLGEDLDRWAQNPETQEQWKKLAQEDGKPVDIRELIPRR